MFWSVTQSLLDGLWTSFEIFIFTLLFHCLWDWFCHLER